MPTSTHTATNGTGQIHTYHGGLNDTTNNTLNLNYNNITGFSHGHHARAGGGNNIFNFTNIHRVDSTIVGRLEDFDPSSDKIQIDGVDVDLYNPPSNVRIVEFNGNHNDPNSTPQQWLLIDTGQGHIFYSLSGARVDMNGNGSANTGDQEGHFIQSNQVPNFSTLTDVDFVDPQNYVPAGMTPNGGIIIQDDDKDAADVLANISGSNGGDLISGGLNNDKIYAGDGNDTVWGGTGNDTIYGGNQNDVIYGGGGNDKIIGGKGNDIGYGGLGNDVISGWGGNDSIYGGKGNDKLYGQQGNDTFDGGQGNDKMYGSTGNDSLAGGSGNDVLNGGSGTDHMTGGSGADTFEFKSGDLMDWDNLGGNWTQKNAQLDVIHDFVLGVDSIEFDNYSNVDDRSDLRAFKTTIDGNVYFTVQVRDTNERILVDVDDSTSWGDFFGSSNFDDNFTII
ncbi:calcium-binding protein [Cochlodiniinecator piscidefendens]|uniref:calcium-binding protein n=1 Tax=Cochlodiniinecator piscidefendens TaxID=2715756 RepID=UPI00140CD730|nr:calcium-binding protein [Cochlodiniinecator piscidefendens]